MNIKSPWLLSFVPLLLTACGDDIRDTLGLNKDAPDEFVVVSRPPLSVPPDFELRPPSADGASPVPSTETQAQSVLFGTKPEATPANAGTHTPSPRRTLPDVTVTPPMKSTPALSSFLKKAGADTATPDIREQLSVDATRPIPTSKAGSLYEEIVGSEKSDPVVDAQKETKRLKDNKNEGKPVTEGETPSAPAPNKSVLDRVF